MTIGSKSRDDRGLVYTYVYRPASTPQYQNEAYWPAGTLWTKTWNGTDYPSQKPTYEKFSWYVPRLKKTFHCRFRKDKPTRSKIDDHPYSCHIRQDTTNHTVYNRFEYGVLESITSSVSSNDFGAPAFGVSNEWNSNDDIALIGKLREKIAGSDFNMGVFLREGGESLKLITDSATRIFKALRYVKHGDVVSAAKQLFIKDPQRFSTVSRALHKGSKDLSGAWLELQYGWYPLIKDVQGAAEFLAKTLEYPMIQTYRVRSTKKQKIVFFDEINWLSQSGSCITQAQLIARLTEVDVYKLSGLTDPASVIWEAMPWSFVADWFIPIGNYLAARGLVNALTGTFVTSKTRRCSWNHSGRKANNSGLFGVTGNYLSGGPILQGFEINSDRTVTSSLTVPLPQFKTLDKVASWQHCANAVALLTQKLF